MQDIWRLQKLPRQLHQGCAAACCLCLEPQKSLHEPAGGLPGQPLLVQGSNVMLVISERLARCSGQMPG